MECFEPFVLAIFLGVVGGMFSLSCMFSRLEDLEGRDSTASRDISHPTHKSKYQPPFVSALFLCEIDNLLGQETASHSHTRRLRQKCKERARIASRSSE